MLRVFEAFAGYGSQSIALRNLGIEHEVVAISEIDKYAIKAYEAIHGPANIWMLLIPFYTKCLMSSSFKCSTYTSSPRK